MPTLTVYEFEVFDPRRRAWMKLARLGTLEAIARLDGIPLKSSAMVVDASLVDAQGMLASTPEVHGGG